MAANLNQDWNIKPQQRFIVARALVGSVIVDTVSNRGLLILAVEVYGRDPDMDSYSEPRISSAFSRRTTSYPSMDNDNLYMGALHQAEGKNVIIGAHPFNALVTFGMRIDSMTYGLEC